MTIDELKDHSDIRDDGIERKIGKLETKIDIVDDFLRDGLTEKIIKGIIDYLNEQTAKRVHLFFKIVITAVVIGLISCGIKMLIF